jgi:hypothetical protein
LRLCRTGGYPVVAHAEQDLADGHSGKECDRPGQGPVLAQGVDGQLGGHRLGERRQSPEEPEESPQRIIQR